MEQGVYLVCELFAFTCLALGIFTGLRTLHRHADTFQEFDWRDIRWKRDRRGIKYIVVSCSTASCCIDVVLRCATFYYVGWLDMDLVFKLLYIVLIHGFSVGLFSSLVHVMVDYELADTGEPTAQEKEQS